LSPLLSCASCAASWQAAFVVEAAQEAHDGLEDKAQCKLLSEIANWNAAGTWLSF